MTAGMIVQLPVTVAFGTDEEFDLRVRLESELTTALAAVGAGQCASSDIDTSHMNLHLGGIVDPISTLNVAKTVLARSGLLGRAVVVLETRSKADPDDPNLQILWPPNQSSIARSA
ncbi:MAG: hypothetical protein K8U57_28295 [Planctomycetes bacterium]|nr:hypothetical protein [Planctomycetota bacterium]